MNIREQLFALVWRRRLRWTLYGHTRTRKVIKVRGWRTALVSNEIDGLGEIDRCTVTFMFKVGRYYL